MTRVLRTDDVDAMEASIAAALADRLGRSGEKETGYAFDPGILAFVCTQILIPILVSFTTDGLKAVLKGHKIGKVSKKDARELAQDLVGREVSPSRPLTAEAFEALAEQLRPLGMTDAAIYEVFDSVRDRLLAA